MVRCDLLVLGSGGQVGRALLEVAPEFGLTLRGLTRADLDIADAVSVVRALDRTRPALVINAAAFTDVDGAEGAEAAAAAVNSHGAAHVVRACARSGAALIHISTDYVFSGAAGRPWRPDDKPAPINAYGRSKLAGEEAVRTVMPDAAIVRTAWVFSPWGKNFVRRVLRLRETHTHLRVVDDQIGGPTSAFDLARALCRAGPQVCRGLGGTHHFCGHPPVSWWGFTQEIFAQAGGPQPVVEAIPSRDWPTRAARPTNSMLDSSSFEAAYGCRPADWRTSLGEVLWRLRQEA